MKWYDNGGWWMPDREQHLQKWMDSVGDRRADAKGNERLLYQGHKYRRALEWVNDRRVAVDIGGHVGLWSWQMAQDFTAVHAFEPMGEHRACWVKNMEGVTTPCTLYPCALGENQDTVRVVTRTPDSSGDTGVDPTGTEGEEVSMYMLDDFGLEDVDLIKIDCEGYEVFVLKGAVDTLLRCKPCVIVEQKEETGGYKRYGVGVTDAVTFLESLGAKRRVGIQGDYILSW